MTAEIDAEGVFRSVAQQDVSGGKPVAVDGTDGNLWGMQVDLDAAKEEIRNLTVCRNLHLDFYHSQLGWHLVYLTAQKALQQYFRGSLTAVLLVGIPANRRTMAGRSSMKSSAALGSEASRTS